MIKKLFVIFAVLALIAGTAYAADLNDGLTRQVWGQAKGRSVVSDGSVALRVWYVGTASPSIGVSSSSVNLYEDGVLTTAAFTTYPTIQFVVDYIDGLANWGAAVGPDLYGNVLIGGGVTGFPIEATTTTAGTSKQNPTSIRWDSGTSRKLFAGADATEGKFNRIKQITSKYASTGPGVVTVEVYDGNTRVWRKDISFTATGGSYNTATDKNASPDTITFMNYTDKGIAGGLGKSLVAVVSVDSATILSSPVASDKLSDHNISILYDQF